MPLCNLMDLNITLSMLKVIAVQSYFRLLKRRNDLEFSSSFTRVICEVTLNWKFLKGPSSWFVNYENVFLSSSLVNTIFFCCNYFQIIFRFTRIKHGIVKKKIKGSRNTFCYLEYGPTTALSPSTSLPVATTSPGLKSRRTMAWVSCIRR